MAQREARRLRRGRVPANDADLGSVRAGKPGRGSGNVVLFMAAVELNAAGHPQAVRSDARASLKEPALANWARKAQYARVHMFPDGLASLAAAGVADNGVVRPRQSSDLAAFAWVNTFTANLKIPTRGANQNSRRLAL